jgi:hypothetical protein
MAFAQTTSPFTAHATESSALRRGWEGLGAEWSALKDLMHDIHTNWTAAKSAPAPREDDMALAFGDYPHLPDKLVRHFER